MGFLEKIKAKLEDLLQLEEEWKAWKVHMSKTSLKGMNLDRSYNQIKKYPSLAVSRDLIPNLQVSYPWCHTKQTIHCRLQHTLDTAFLHTYYIDSLRQLFSPWSHINIFAVTNLVYSASQASNCKTILTKQIKNKD